MRQTAGTDGHMRLSTRGRGKWITRSPLYARLPHAHLVEQSGVDDVVLVVADAVGDEFVAA